MIFDNLVAVIAYMIRNKFIDYKEYIQIFAGRGFIDDESDDWNYNHEEIRIFYLLL